MAFATIQVGVLLWRATIALLMVLSIKYLARGYQVRKMYKDLEKQGIPIMRHSWIFGHLEIMGKIMRYIPKDAHFDYVGNVLVKEWREFFPDCKSCPPLVYLDIWPFSAPSLFSLSPEVSVQFTQNFSARKPPQHAVVNHPMTHGHDLSSGAGEYWNLWRKRLNPIFSMQQITSRADEMVEEVEVFIDQLKSRAGKDGAWGSVFPLQRLTMNLAMDVIYRYIMEERLYEQTQSPSLLMTTVASIIGNMHFNINISNLHIVYSPWRQWKLWSDYRTLSRILWTVLKKRIDNRHDAKDGGGGYKTYVDVMAQVEDEDVRTGRSSALDFKKDVVGHMGMFLFAGHDTTAISLASVIDTISGLPDVLARLRAELDEALGTDPNLAADKIRENPSMLNMLPYLNAVLKEALRHNSNVGTVRIGEAGLTIVGPTGSLMEGMRLPTEGFLMFSLTTAIHMNPDHWTRAEDFLPERFLPGIGEDDPLRPPKNAWRFFELGLRNCIGQNISLLEMKIALALAFHALDFESAWGEWDAQRNFKGKPQTFYGKRAYQTMPSETAPKLKDELPIRVRLRAA